MGKSSQGFLGLSINMKLFVATAIAVAAAHAEPEAKAEVKADPYLLWGYGYPGYYYGKRSADAQPEAKPDPYLLTYGYLAYGYGYGLYGKRSADQQTSCHRDHSHIRMLGSRRSGGRGQVWLLAEHQQTSFRSNSRDSRSPRGGRDQPWPQP